MDDARFFAIAQKLSQLSQQYTTQQLKHYQYVQEYDKTLDSYGITKKELVAEVERRNNPNYQPEPTKSPPVIKPVPKRR